MGVWLRELSVGKWFEAGGDPFEIVGIDTKAEIVLIQYYDGAIDELDFEAWLELEARPCSPPEDLMGALDAERDDFGLEESHTGHPSSQDAMGWLESHGL